MKINIKYIFAFLILLITEVIIALFVKDAIIRPFIGDILVIILMYTFTKGFINKPIRLLPLCLFIFAVIVEISQYYHLVNILHLQGNKLICTIMGTSYDNRDILCYLAGSMLLFVWEKVEKLIFKYNECDFHREATMKERL